MRFLILSLCQLATLNNQMTNSFHFLYLYLRPRLKIDILGPEEILATRKEPTRYIAKNTPCSFDVYLIDCFYKMNSFVCEVHAVKTNN